MSNSYIIIIVKGVYKFSQSVARQKVKDGYNASLNGNMISLII